MLHKRVSYLPLRTSHLVPNMIVDSVFKGTCDCLLLRTWVGGCLMKTSLCSPDGGLRGLLPVTPTFHSFTAAAACSTFCLVHYRCLKYMAAGRQLRAGFLHAVMSKPQPRVGYGSTLKIVYFVYRGETLRKYFRKHPSGLLFSHLSTNALH